MNFTPCWVTVVCFSFFCLTQNSASSYALLSPGHILSDANNQTLDSADGTFHLGFFSPGSSKNRYLGIWYQKDPAVVWVANRNSSLADTSGALILTPKGLLLLLNGDNTTIWSSSITRKPAANLSLQLLNSGNLVVKDGNSTFSGNFLWQSFDYPCDTLLPGMKIGKNFVTGKDTFLTSWKSDEDPQEGHFSMLIDTRGFPQMVVRNQRVNYYRLGSWNGIQFTGTPMLQPNEYIKYEFVSNAVEVYYMYEVIIPSVQTRLLVNQSGFVQRYVCSAARCIWSMRYSAPLDGCDNYAYCGVHMTCNFVDNSPTCVCLDGFKPRSLENQRDGCVRKVPLDCRNGLFQNYTGLKLPDTSLSGFRASTSLEDCHKICFRNCSCMAYADSDISKPDAGCLLWFGELADLRKYDNGGQTLFIRMSAPTLKKPKSNSRRKYIVTIIAASIAIAGLLGVGLTVFLYWRRRIQGKRESIFRRDNHSKQGGDDEMDLQMYDRATIVKATNNFSLDNKLGQGGFGPVYKGTLTDGKEIAVKTLSKSSGQGTTEFKNEVILIARLQHRNLVKLLGCCIEGDEKMLIYEYMPNKSLDFFIFDETKNQLLDWTTRIAIVNGIAKGLLYLHEDSRLRIIHRDLKASNVLLDKDMNPKISDFGMARIFGGDQIEANTNKVVGTFGYMSPEYAIDGLFSMKSDVYSFGVLMLEIISGKKNRGFSHKDHGLNLLGHAWKLWMEGRPIELADNVVDESSIINEVVRCIHVGLLCVQQKPDDRPSMSSVVVMLSSDIFLPQPKQPGFFTERNVPGFDYTSTNIKSNWRHKKLTQMQGTLPEGQGIAVKRLSKSSGQGLNEFKNEVILFSKLQHRNLVKLLGCCICEDEKMLIYEYMPNKSLNSIIFDKSRSNKLDWCMRNQIIDGIARGLLYLHQDSRLRIIHRDLKASNILLDNDMKPKISDFGLAKTFGADQTEAKTNRVVGTHGYMSPEYVVDGKYSMKSDIFSFGVLVLELVSGKRNRGFHHPSHDLNLLGHAWTQWMKGSALEIIDECLMEPSNASQAILRYIQVALLCVQQRPEDRPNISSVVLMLGSVDPLPQPKQPGFLIARNPIDVRDNSLTKNETQSVNEVTVTVLEAR
ncbi:G-type lectin S-receptor-like serine/threonine-protein kinase SD1-1 [Linum perenne]